MPVTGPGAVLLIVLLTWAAGTLAGAAWAQSWSVVKRGHFRIVAWTAMVLAIVALSSAVPATQGVEGAGIQRLASAFFAASALVYLVAQYGSDDQVATAVGAGASVVGAFAVAVTAGMLEEWSPVVSIAALVAGAAGLGAVTNGMLLGHWYLNQPGLAPWALARLTTAGLVALALSGLVGLMSVRTLMGAPTEGAALGLPGFGQDLGPAFFFIWFALVVFSIAIVYMARRCIAIRSIQSATGLYYVALLTVGVSEFLVRYLMVNAG